MLNEALLASKASPCIVLLKSDSWSVTRYTESDLLNAHVLMSWDMSASLRGIPSHIEDWGFAVLATFLAFIYGAIATNGSQQEIVQAILAILFIPALLFWRTRPTASSVAMLLLMALWTANWFSALPLNLGFTPFVLVMPIIVYTTARFLERRIISFLFYAAALVYCFVSPIMWYQTESGMLYHSSDQGLSWLLIQWLGLTVIRQIAINRRREEDRHAEQQRNREHAALEEQSAIRERERVQIAREIHDVLAHSLTLINVQASAGIMVARQRPSKDHAGHEEILESIQDTSSSALAEVRGIVKALRSETDSISLDEITNLASAVEQIDKYRKTGMEITASLPSDRDLAEISSSSPLIVQLGVRRILNESLTNVVRHQGVGSRVEVDISVDWEDDEITLDIESWSPGGQDEVSPALTGTKSGLIGMQERVDSLNGQIQYHSRQGYFRVQASLPTSPC